MPIHPASIRRASELMCLPHQSRPDSGIGWPGGIEEGDFNVDQRRPRRGPRSAVVRHFQEKPMRKQALLALAVAAALAAPLAEARVTRIEITAQEIADVRRLFVARRWPVREDRRQGLRRGQSERPKNRVIVDIELAPRNARGNVEYAFNFYILKPIDLTNGAHKMMYEPPNRGGKTWSALGRGHRRRQRPGLDHRSRGAGECVPHAARLHDRPGAAGTTSARRHRASANFQRSPIPADRRRIRTARRSPARPTSTS